jgi:UDP-2,3-diacylglucosamine pyrophosphatase LpxH
MSIKETIKELSRGKKILLFLFMILPAVLIALVLAIMLPMHGTIGFLVWTLPILYLLVIVSVICFSVPLLGILDVVVALKRKAKRALKVPSRGFLAVGLIFTILSSVFLVLIGVVPNLATGDKAPQLVMLGKTGTNGIPDFAVVFWTETSTNPELDFGMGSSELDLDQVIVDAYVGTSQKHVFFLRDLICDTQYVYRIDSGTPGILYNFTTMPAAIDQLKFGFSTDAHFIRDVSNNTASRHMLSYMRNSVNNFDFFLCGGDITEFGFLDNDWTRALNVMSPYTTCLPSSFVVGNHETILNGIQKYKNYIYPDKVIEADGDQQLYRHLNFHDTIHIFILDLEWGIETYTAAQKAWFEAELATVDIDDWLIIVSHCMFYSSGLVNLAGTNWNDQPDMINTFEDLFIDKDVDIVFSGHNHHMEVLNVSSIVYNVCGGFGGIPDDPRDAVGTGSLWYLPGQLGFVECEISGNIATLTYRTPEGAAIPSGTFTVAEDVRAG